MICNRCAPKLLCLSVCLSVCLYSNLQLSTVPPVETTPSFTSFQISWYLERRYSKVLSLLQTDRQRTAHMYRVHASASCASGDRIWSQFRTRNNLLALSAISLFFLASNNRVSYSLYFWLDYGVYTLFLLGLECDIIFVEFFLFFLDGFEGFCLSSWWQR